MTPDELIQLMRTCSMAQVRAELERMAKHPESDYVRVVAFYKRAARRKKAP